MKEITLQQARDALLAACPAMYREVVQYLQLPPFLQPRVKAWMEERIVVLRYPRFLAGGFDADTWTYCCLTPSDPAVEAELDRLFAETVPVAQDERQICYPGRAPENRDSGMGALYYAAVGRSEETDSRIRVLHPESDGELIETLVGYAAEDPGDFADIANMLENDLGLAQEDLREHGETPYRFLGWIEDGCPVGVVSLRADPEGGAVICNLYVDPACRRLGVGKTLLRAALTLEPGKDYCYSHRRENTVSGLTALAAGFAPAGQCVCLPE